MKDVGIIEVIKRLLRVRTRESALELAESCGNDYRHLATELARRIEYSRTHSQNNLLHKWIAEVAKQTGEDAEDVKAREKYLIGLPLVFRDNPDQVDRFKAVMEVLPYERRVAAMKLIPLTSILNTSQMAEFMDAFERKYRSQGMQLTMPEAA